MAKFEETKCK